MHIACAATIRVAAMVSSETDRRFDGKLTSPVVGIVDDDAMVRESFSSFLRSAGYRTELFESAEAFSALADKRTISCLLLDCHMPGMSGLELHARLAQLNIVIPTIYVTADDAAIRTCAFRQGAVAVLAKPVRGDLLLEAVKSALGHK